MPISLLNYNLFFFSREWKTAALVVIGRWFSHSCSITGSDPGYKRIGTRPSNLIHHLSRRMSDSSRTLISLRYYSEQNSKLFYDLTLKNSQWLWSFLWHVHHTTRLLKAICANPVEVKSLHPPSRIWKNKRNFNN